MLVYRDLISRLAKNLFYIYIILFRREPELLICESQITNINMKKKILG